MKKSKYLFISLFALVLIWALLPKLRLIAQDDEEVEVSEAAATSEKQVVSLTELQDLLLKGKGDEVVLSDLDIRPTSGDSKLAEEKIFFSVYVLKTEGQSPKRISFYNCDFHTSDNSPIVFRDWIFKKLNFVACSSDAPLLFENCSLEGNYPIHFENCNFLNDLTFNNTDKEIRKLEILNCIFHKSMNLEANVGKLEIGHCRFEADTARFREEDEENTLYQLNMAGQSYGDVDIIEARFNNFCLPFLFSADLSGSQISGLNILNSKMNSLNLSRATVEKTLLIDSLEVTDYIGIQNFDFPETNTNIPWYNLEGQKLAIFQYEHGDRIIPYQAKSDEQISKTLMYNDLVSAYNKLNSMYHSRGDITSANGSYVEIKDIETRRQRYLLNTQPSLNILINYELNIFLRNFSDYATNPGKSLRQSFILILIFTFLYMLTFSEWDRLDYEFHKKEYEKFVFYISHEIKISCCL